MFKYCFLYLYNLYKTLEYGWKMAEREQFIPGITIKESIDNLAAAMPHADLSVIDRLEIQPSEDRDQERDRAGNRYGIEHGPRNLHWRKDGFPESRYRPENPRTINYLKNKHRDGEEILLDEFEPTHNGYWGTNQILEYFGLTTDEDRTSYLRDFNGDIYKGVDVVRTAFTLGGFYGLLDEDIIKPENRKSIFKDFASSIHEFGTRLTERVIDAVGIENLKGVVENYTPYRVKNGFLDLVPTRDLDRIVSVMTNPDFQHLKGRDVMRELGYKVFRDVEGAPLLYYQPIKPV